MALRSSALADRLRRRCSSTVLLASAERPVAGRRATAAPAAAAAWPAATWSGRVAAVASSSGRAPPLRRPYSLGRGAADLLRLSSSSSRGVVSQARRGNPQCLGSSDQELFEQVFAPFGVSELQFKELMRAGYRCGVAENCTIVKGGEPLNKILLILQGEAVAHTYVEGEEAKSDQPVCRYLGRLSGGDTEDDPTKVPVRGSVIGGSALIDSSVQSSAYPMHIVSKTPMEWIEWDRNLLDQAINQKFRRALQASVYHLLYQELLFTLQREKAAQLFRKKAKVTQSTDALAEPPSSGQLLSLSLFIAVPFFGFGFADNLIMIVCGDMIDAQFGARLGLTTLAAAGLGNWVSDVVGLSLGDMIERNCVRLGLSNGNLTPVQEKMRIAQFTSTFAKIVGISLGCFAGMVPLLFLTPTRQEFTNEDLHMYDTVFGPSGATTTQFSSLMEKGRRCRAREDQIIVQGGVQQKKVLFLLHGEAVAYEYDPDVESFRGKVEGSYTGRLDEPGTAQPTGRARGSIIGGGLLVGEIAADLPYPRVVVAKAAVEWVEWDLAELQAIMSDQKSLQAAFTLAVYDDLLSQRKRDKENARLKTYRVLVQAILADGVVSPEERHKLQEFKDKLKISDEEHYRIVLDEGWTAEDWSRGTLEAISDFQRTFSSQTKQATSESAQAAADVQKLLAAAASMQEVANRLQAASR